MLCLITVLLMAFPLCICRGETADLQQADVNMSLVSYDILDREPDDTSVWLRYKVEYDTKQFVIDEIELDYHGPHEEDDIISDVLSQSDPAIYEYIYGHISIYKQVDDDYVKEMITEGSLEGQIVLCNRNTDELFNCSCKVYSENAIMGTDYNPDEYRIEVNQYECEKIEEPDSCYRLYPGLEEYVESHPGIECYKITFFGKEYMSAAGKAILFPKFTSSSDGLFLYREGGIFETAGEASDAYDLIIEGQKDICFRGVICAENSDSLQDRIRKAEMSIAFSNEFAGTFDMSDAGDRFSGPKKVILPIIVSDDLMRK